MFTSKFFFFINKINIDFKKKINIYKLILNIGLIYKSNPGIYFWLPLGFKILKKIKKIIRNELLKINAFEVLIPILQSINIWKKSNRLDKYGKEIFIFLDRNKKKLLLSPTNEEIVNSLIKNKIISYKNLPIIFYQIQSKFRDEIRPCFKSIKFKEFIMKDAYSFHLNKICLIKTFNKVLKSYIKIFKKLKLNFIIKKANTKFIGGKLSYEFITYNKKKEYKKNKKFYIKIRNIKLKKKKLISTSYKNKFKLLLFKTIEDYNLVIICNNHKLNISKIKKINNFLFICKKNKIYSFLKKKNIILNNIKFNIILDNNIAIINNLKNSNNIKIMKLIKIKNNNQIELAHIFNVGSKYSKLMCNFIKNKDNKKKYYKMGCYGIGIDRILISIIKQNIKNKKRLWPINLSPYKVLIIPVNMFNFLEVKKISLFLYFIFKKRKIKFLFEDRKKYIGNIFNELEIISIPNVFIISINNLKNNIIEYKNTYLKKKKLIKIYNIYNFLNKIIK